MSSRSTLLENNSRLPNEVQPEHTKRFQSTLELELCAHVYTILIIIIGLVPSRRRDCLTRRDEIAASLMISIDTAVLQWRRWRHLHLLVVSHYVSISGATVLKKRTDIHIFWFESGKGGVNRRRRDIPTHGLSLSAALLFVCYRYRLELLHHPVRELDEIGATASYSSQNV